MIRPPRITFPVAACHGCGDATEHRYAATGVPCCDECQRACDASLAHCDAASHGTDCNACATWRRVIGVDLCAEPAPGTDDGDLAEIDALFTSMADDTIAAIEADPTAGIEHDDWPEGSGLPWELASTPPTYPKARSRAKLTLVRGGGDAMDSGEYAMGVS